ncbi:MAG: NUDIX domain-containing protein [Thermodesulfobacteriota bacterium]|nr:NUDIX domain-containing protein [Thermodesulfobacteriota bacterium]
MEKDRIVIIVGAVVEDGKDNILLVKKIPEGDECKDRKWTCPVRRLKVGEKIVDGIKRGIREETNLNIELRTLIRPFERIVRSAHGIKLHNVYVNYLAQVVNGELILKYGIEEAIWVNKCSISGIWNELDKDTRKLLTLSGLLG